MMWELLKTLAIITAPILTGLVSWLVVTVIDLKMKITEIQVNEKNTLKDIENMKDTFKEILLKLDYLPEIKADLKHFENNLKQLMEKID